MDHARTKFKNLAKKVEEMNLSPEILSSLPALEKLSGIPKSYVKPQRQRVFTCGVVLALVLILGAFIPFTFMVLYEVQILPETPRIQTIHRAIAYFWLEGFMQLSIEDEDCILENVEEIQDVFRPPVDCNICMNVTEVDKVSNLDPEEFVAKYAYSGQPIVITDATTNWTARAHFTFNFFKSIYGKESPVLEGEEENCQFFPYKTNFENLGEVFQMSASRSGLLDGSDPWYIGWSNCDSTAANILRQYYQRPYFLPTNSESSKTDWIFMGSPGYGAPLHIDNVELVSWQAQIKGTKQWTLEPPPECYLQCHSLEVTVYPGEIIVLDTNKWFHGTLILGDEMSIVIGSEYD